MYEVFRRGLSISGEGVWGVEGLTGVERGQGRGKQPVPGAWQVSHAQIQRREAVLGPPAT